MKNVVLFLVILVAFIHARSQNTDVSKKSLSAKRSILPEKSFITKPDNSLGYCFYEESQNKKTNITIDGTWSYTYYCNDHNTNITGGQITNNTSDTQSGTLKLMLFLMNYVYTGSNLSGWSLFEHNMGQLNPNQYIYNINWWSPFINYPANGSYYVTLALLEYNNGSYYVIDYLNYTNITNYSCNPNGIGDTTSGNEITIKQTINNSVSVEIPEFSHSDLCFQINDLGGKVVYKAEFEQHSNIVDLSFLNSGIYFSAVLDKNKVLARQKIVIIK